MATDVLTAETPASVPDERLAYRGPIQRLLVQPEIGALLGAISRARLALCLKSKPGTPRFKQLNGLPKRSRKRWQSWAGKVWSSSAPIPKT